MVAYLVLRVMSDIAGRARRSAAERT
jgi:hypothetical protein